MAQLVAQVPVKDKVLGSNPSVGATFHTEGYNHVNYMEESPIKL